VKIREDRGEQGEPGRGKAPWWDNKAEDFKAQMSNVKRLRAHPHSSCFVLAPTRKGNGQGDGFEGPKLLRTNYLERTRKVLRNTPERKKGKKKGQSTRGGGKGDAEKSAVRNEKQLNRKRKRSGKRWKGGGGQGRKRLERRLRP